MQMGIDNKKQISLSKYNKMWALGGF